MPDRTVVIKPLDPASIRLDEEVRDEQKLNRRKRKDFESLSTLQQKKKLTANQQILHD
jgi:hypothetical protein